MHQIHDIRYTPYVVKEVVKEGYGFAIYFISDPTWTSAEIAEELRTPRYQEGYDYFLISTYDSVAETMNISLEKAIR
jgi:hypothetical protein